MKAKNIVFYGLITAIIAAAFLGCNPEPEPEPEPTHTHDYGTVWKSNETQHWRECSCGDKIDVARHTGNPCTVCDYEDPVITYTATQTGGIDGEVDSTGIVFTFSESVDSLNLSAGNITVAGKAGKRSTAALIKSGTTSLTLSPVTVNGAGTATVKINKDGIEAAAKNVTVYKAGAMVPQILTINWHLNGGAAGTGAYPAQIDKGGTLANPSPDPTKAGNIFGGWHTDSSLTQAYNFANPVTANLNLYAKWKPLTGTTVTGSTLAEKLAWVLNESNVQSGQTYTIEVSAGEAINPHTLSYTSRNNITIILWSNGAERIVSISSNNNNSSPLFTVRNSVTLVLDNNVTLEGRNNNTASLVRVNAGGTLKMEAGAKISDNSSSGVYVDGGTFTMNNGEISGNSSRSGNRAGSGGGVYVAGGTFTMNGGEISGNTTAGSGGSGGGVYVGDGTFTMADGEISGNTAGSGGGVVVGGGGTFTMSGGEISGNTADSGGGGVHVGSSGTFNKTGGIITGYTSDTLNGNVVKGSSGNVINFQGHAVRTPSKIKETTAGEDVNLYYSAYFNLDGGSEFIRGEWDN